MSYPYGVAKRYACKLFLEMREGRAAIIEAGLRLEVSFKVDEIPNFGLWINRGAWTPLKRGKPYSNISFEPCIGAPDTLEEALGAWKNAHWLEVGQSRRWSLRWRAVAVPIDVESAKS